MGSRAKPKQWLEFKKVASAAGRKTDVWNIYNHTQEYLGYVHYRAGWRKYVAGVESSNWSSECLDQLSKFLKVQNHARKSAAAVSERSGD